MVTKCKGCGLELSIDAFYASNKGKCKECVKAAVKKRSRDKPDQLRAYEKMRSQLPHRMALNRKMAEEWRSANPARRKAQVALGNAVRDGRVIRWPVCAMPECESRPVAHHPDYGNPLSVVWLCQTHHKRLHAEHEQCASNC